MIGLSLAVTAPRPTLVTLRVERGSPHLPGRHPNKRGIPDADVFTVSRTSMAGRGSTDACSDFEPVYLFRTSSRGAGIDRGVAESLHRGGPIRQPKVLGIKTVVFRCHVMSIIMLVYVYRGNVSRGLLLGITLVLGLSSLPHLLSEVIGFSTMFGKSSNLSTLEVKEAAPSAQLLYR